MSDMLNERFGALVKEQNIILEAGDPMPTVTASVIPASGSEPSQVSDIQTAKAGGKDPAPSVPPTVAIGQKAPVDLGGSTSGPLHDDEEEGEENPGAKAAAPISQISGDAQQAHQKNPGDATPTVGVQVAYGTSKGPDVAYPIKPSFEELDLSGDVAALTEGEDLSEEYKNKAKTIFEAAVKAKLVEEHTKLVEHFETKLTEQVEAVKAELSEEVNGITISASNV